MLGEAENCQKSKKIQKKMIIKPIQGPKQPPHASKPPFYCKKLAHALYLMNSNHMNLITLKK